MQGMNSPQQEAVRHTEGPLLVLAGAGSGKTRVIIEKIAQMVQKGRYPAHRIAAITFTNKAAREMRERLAKRVRGDAAEGVRICTFHALGLNIVQIDHAKLGLKRGFSIFDPDDVMAQFKDLMPGADKDALYGAMNLVSKAKNLALSPEKAAAYAKSTREKEGAHWYALYQERLQAFNAVDFDDLIRLPLNLLETDEEARAAWRERIGYVLVDEYQDTNDAQYRLLKALAGEQGQFTCVGDDDQSIYAWRGANPENIDTLARDYPSLRVIKLEQNYRCSNRVLRAANALIANNPHTHPKQLWSEAKDGERIRVWECNDEAHEAEKVAAEIQFMATKHGAPWSDFCVLFRGNHQSRAMEKAMQMLRIPYHLSGGTAFLERQEVKDILSWVRVMVNPDDDSAFLRAVQAPGRGVGQTTLAKLSELARAKHLSMAHAIASMSVLQQLPTRASNALDQFNETLHHLRQYATQHPPDQVIRHIAERSGLLAQIRSECKNEQLFTLRKNNVEELASWFEGGKGQGIADLASQLALLSRNDKDDAGNQVRLMSMHAAKGLEFRFVFIIGMQEGVLPHEASLEEGRLEEERRLLYVAITRAKEQLWMSYASGGKKWGERVTRLPSRFFEELPAAELHRDGLDPEADKARSQERSENALANIRAMLGR